MQWAGEVATGFHARHAALRRIYRYYILNRSARSALQRARTAWIHRPLDAAAMHAAAQALIGEHDFSAFRSIECQSKTRGAAGRADRRCSATAITLWLEIAANAYLHHMVRNIVGTLLDVQQRHRSAGAMSRILAGGDRRLAGATAPAAGLYLWRVEYPPAVRHPMRPQGGFAKLAHVLVRANRPVAHQDRAPHPLGAEGLWTKCPACDAVLYRAEIERNLHVCPKCSHHMRINGRERLLKFLDTGSTKEIAAKVEPEDPLKFKDSKRYRGPARCRRRSRPASATRSS